MTNTWNANHLAAAGMRIVAPPVDAPPAFATDANRPIH